MLPRPEGWVGGGTEPTALGSSVCHRARAAPTDTGGSRAGETQLLLPRRAGLTLGPTCRQPGRSVGSHTAGTHGSFPAAPRKQTRQVRIPRPTHRPSSGPGRRGPRGELGPGVGSANLCGPAGSLRPTEPTPLGGLASATPAAAQGCGEAPTPRTPAGPPALTGLRRFSVTFFQSKRWSWCRNPMAGPGPAPGRGVPRSAHGSPAAHRHGPPGRHRSPQQAGGEAGSGPAPARPGLAQHRPLKAPPAAAAPPGARPRGDPATQDSLEPCEGWSPGGTVTPGLGGLLAERQSLVDPVSPGETEARSSRGTAWGRPLQRSCLPGCGLPGSQAPAPGSCQVRETLSPRELPLELLLRLPKTETKRGHPQLSISSTFAPPGQTCLRGACQVVVLFPTHTAAGPAAPAQPIPWTSAGVSTCVLGWDHLACTKLHSQPSCDSKAGNDTLNSSKH